MLNDQLPTFPNRVRWLNGYFIRFAFLVVTGCALYLLMQASIITPATAQTSTACMTRWVYETLQSQTPATCGPPETFVHHSTVVDDHSPFPVAAPNVDITFTGGRITWWGTYAYGTSVESISNYTPCYATQIAMQISQTAETVRVQVGRLNHPPGTPPVPLTVTDNLGRTQQFDLFSGANVVMTGGGITTLTFSTPNVPFYIDSFNWDPQCSVTAMDLIPLNSPLDTNPNTGGGRRIFPDRLTPGDTTNRRMVRVRASTDFGSNVTVYFRAFDLDDPSTDAAPVDSNAAAGNDNRGTPQSGILSAGSTQTDANGVAQVDLTVSMQPGDNFIVAASRDQAYLNGLTINGINLRDTNNVQLPTSKARATEMLTVWRRLHIERESMGLVAGNRVTGRTSSVTPNAAANQTVIAAGNHANLELNRFQNGRMVLTSVGAYPVVSNTSNSVTVQGIINNIPNNTNYTLFDDDDFNGNNGSTPNGDIGENVTPPDVSLIQNSDNVAGNVFADAYVRPIYDVGDNNDLVPFLLNSPDTRPTLVATYDFDSSNTQNDPGFWTVYLLGAYQCLATEDNDPSTEGATLGIVDGYPFFDQLSGLGASVFNEVLRSGEITITPEVNNAATTAHEIGHLFNGEHTDGGLMEQSSTRTTTALSAATLAKIRDISNP